MAVPKHLDAGNLGYIAHICAASVKVKHVQTLLKFIMKMIESLKNCIAYMHVFYDILDHCKFD